MPNIEPVTAQQDQVHLRHVGPVAAVWPRAPVGLQKFTVLGQSTMVARPLPASSVPGTPDFVSGGYTLRLDDAGESSLLFPNANASDGIPWRTRFDPTGHLQFVEIYFNNELDAVGVIDQVSPSQGSVSVHTDDGMWLLKKAYVRDWTVTMAPRDVVERGTGLWVPVTVSNFPGPTLDPQFYYRSGCAAVPTGGVQMTVTNPSGQALMLGPTVSVPATGVWSARCEIAVPSGDSAIATYVGEFLFEVYEETSSGSSPTGYGISLFGNSDGTAVVAGLLPAGGGSIVDESATYSLLVESDGEWVTAFVNGAFVGQSRRISPAPTSLYVQAYGLPNGNQSGSGTLTVQSLLVESLQPFLMRGADKGDYVLPGDATSYPTGGLSARYFNDNDLVGDQNYFNDVLAPCRQQSYGGSSPAEYADQLDATVNGQTPPTGAGPAYWSCVWYGAVYLKLSGGGSYTLQVQLPAATTCRLWVGQTAWGSQCIEQWTMYPGPTLPGGTVSAASLAGTLPDGQGTIARDGWYPIKLEYVTNYASSVAPVLEFQPPAGYTDPGGTAISASGLQVVPSTSLSPLGCVDQRYQGISHFDLVQQTLQASGLHASVEPKQLESGLFPGVLAPRIREGHDTDIILKADQDYRTDGEGILNFSSTVDATDFASSIQGNGAGVANGSGGQLQSMVYDPGTLLDSLFDAQVWQDNSDASLPTLLDALLNSQLALSLEPWQSLSADPAGRPRKAFGWPFTGATQAMRWRPGDGVMIREPSINVFDTEPRQMLAVVRNIGGQGIQSTQATFANRPRTEQLAVQRQIFSVTRQQRNYQRQVATLTGTFISGQVANQSTGPWSFVNVGSSQILGAKLIVTWNPSKASIGVAVNGGAGGGGPWTGGQVPLAIDLSGVAHVDASGQFWAAVYNNSSSAAFFSYQLIVDVLI